MRWMPLISMPLAGLLALGAAIEAGGGDDRQTPPPERTGADLDGEAPRVVVHADRHTVVMGHVELEDDDVIVVRTRDGELQSFGKGRILRIVRLVTPAPDQQGLVVLRNGQILEGVIIEDGFDTVEVEIEGVRTRLRRAVVDRVELEPTVEERYAHFKAGLRPEMMLRHLALCQWLVDERRYDLAEKELLDLLSREEIPRARQMLNLVQAQLALQQAPRSAPRSGDRPDPPTDGEPSSRLPDGVLTEEDVNTIRVYEIDFRRPPKLAISRATIKRLIERYGSNSLIPAAERDRDALHRADPIEIVELMFRLQARDLYPEITVLSEPHALNLFRRRVHNTWLVNNCATSDCHGGPGGGRLLLHRRRHQDPRVRYTNLMILETLELDARRPLINYGAPTDSLIIQYGLPRTLARQPHPPAEGWRPVFRSQGDRMIQDTVEWIEAMFQPRPDYPIQFDPPGAEPGPAADAEPAPGAEPEPDAGDTAPVGREQAAATGPGG